MKRVNLPIFSFWMRLLSSRTHLGIKLQYETWYAKKKRFWDTAAGYDITPVSFVVSAVTLSFPSNITWPSSPIWFTTKIIFKERVVFSFTCVVKPLSFTVYVFQHRSRKGDVMRLQIGRLLFYTRKCHAHSSPVRFPELFKNKCRVCVFIKFVLGHKRSVSILPILRVSPPTSCIFIENYEHSRFSREVKPPIRFVDVVAVPYAHASRSTMIITQKTSAFFHSNTVGDVLFGAATSEESSLCLLYIST